MKVETYLPTAQLRPFVKSYTVIESQAEITNRVLPGTSFALAFRLKGEISYINGTAKIALPPVVFTGLKKTYRLIHYGSNAAAIIVLFTQTGGPAFLPGPPQELFEQSISLDSMIRPSEISLVEHRLAESLGLRDKIRVIESFLLSKCRHYANDSLVSAAISKIRCVNGHIRIRELANGLYISQDAFEKRFRKMTGASPKQFAQIIKMNAVIRQNSLADDLPDIAFSNGFYDQPHFNKDFKNFTGQAPTDFFRSASFW